MKVYLDDERCMPAGFDIQVKTADEAIILLATGRVTGISLDHDLGAPENGTGYDVACFIEQEAYRGGMPPFEITIHSANPVGHTRMEHAIAKAMLYWSNRKTLQ